MSFRDYCQDYFSTGGRDRLTSYQQYVELSRTRYVNYYSTIALNRYRWENLPMRNGREVITSYLIEKMLFYHGECFIYENDEFGLICLPSKGIEPDLYNEPTMVEVHGYGFNDIVEVTKGVRIKNTDLATPCSHSVFYYCNELAHCDARMNKNAKQQLMPYFIGTTKDNKLDANIMAQQIEDNVAMTIVDRQHTDDMGKTIVHPTLAPFLLDKFQQHKLSIQRELLEYLGINCSHEKKERLLVDEIHMNNEFIYQSLDIGLKTRKEACEQINRLFGEKYQFELSVANTSDMVTDTLVKGGE